MVGREENRVFVGGLAWETSHRHLQDAFSRYGEILECVVVADRETGRPRGFGFVTFADHRAMDDAISDMDGRELDGRVISVNKAKPKTGDEDVGFEYGRDYISGGSHRGGDRLAGRSECFKCGHPGHFARECPLGDGGGRFSLQVGSGRGGGSRRDRFRLDPYDDHFSRGRYGDRDHLDTRDSRYDSHDRYASNRYNRYAPAREGYAVDRYIDWEPQSEYGRDRGYFRDGGPRPDGERYGSGGPDRFDRGSYRDRTGPYDRHRRGDHISSYNRY